MPTTQVKKIAEVTEVPIEVVDMVHENEISTDVHGLRFGDPELSDAIVRRNDNWANGIDEEGQESYETIVSRAKELTALLEERSEEHIAVATHGFFLKFFTAYHLLGEYLTPEIFLNGINAHAKTTNTGITYLTIVEDSKWILRSWNDAAHLGEIHT